ncbi:histidinol-phosphatase [Malassezia equina]|uniref:Histidinol-phosphatase n=1 Tax=Malassezia equina TaxID=1381935 RepID=A0AAF0ELE0_9BASI|nr:histidinol-phosphatase [Malassezia equina]
MHSHHSHSGEFCKHASSTLNEVLARAYELNFTHFHLSEHVPRFRNQDLYPEEEEAGFTPVELEKQFRSYLDAQYEVMQRLRPEVIGHMDLFRLFDPDAPWIPDASTLAGKAILEKMERNVRFAASYGALFEANSSAFRKGWRHETYPGYVFLQKIKAMKGRIALSDDSHGTGQVALNFARLRTYLLKEDIREIWYLMPGTPPNIPHDVSASFEELETERHVRERSEFPGLNAPDHFPRGTRAVCLSGWESAPFWDTLPAELQTPITPM